VKGLSIEHREQRKRQKECRFMLGARTGRELEWHGWKTDVYTMFLEKGNT